MFIMLSRWPYQRFMWFEGKPMMIIAFVYVIELMYHGVRTLTHEPCVPCHFDESHAKSWSSHQCTPALQNNAQIHTWLHQINITYSMTLIHITLKILN